MSANSATSCQSTTEAERLRVMEELTGLASYLVEVRRQLHRYPELSGQELQTTAYLHQELSWQGLSFTHGPDGLGLVVDLGDGPFVALRADIDALPIQEAADLPFRSEHPGVMHACGHDAHTAMLLGAVTALNKAKPLSCRAIFQSSEEAGQGALDMVHAGALIGVQSIIALHVDPNLPAGSVGITEGPQTACCQDFSLLVKGRGGHAARPHLTIDPIAAGAQLVSMIHQTIPRATDPRHPAIVTVGQFSAGDCANVIPETAALRGTIRALDLDVAERTREHLERVCSGVALATGATIEASFDRLLRGVVNDPGVTAACREAARAIVGDENLILTGQPSMGAEDFADYLTTVPGCMMRLGVRAPGREIHPLHTPTFEIAEDALLVGARLLVEAYFQLRQPYHAH